MEENIAATLIQAGPLGAVILALGVAYYKQSGELRRAQEARVEDAKKVTKTLLELNDKWNTTVSALTAAVKELRVGR